MVGKASRSDEKSSFSFRFSEIEKLQAAIHIAIHNNVVYHVLPMTLNPCRWKYL